MSVKIRLKRVGRKKVDQYRVVVTDHRSPRDGRFLEEIGYYQPQNEPMTINFDEERVHYWLSKGARPSEKVRSLLKKQGLLAQSQESTAPQEA